MIDPYAINIVSVGNWNKKIFNPRWVSTHLFELPDDKEFNAVVNPEEMEFGYVHKGILLLPRENALEVKLEKFDKNSKKFAGVIMNKILSKLPHTPLRAIGINIRYKFEAKDKFAFIDNFKKCHCTFGEFIVSQIKYTKQTDNCNINIITDFLEEIYNMNFNFHYIKAINFDEKFIQEHVDETIEILKNGNK